MQSEHMGPYRGRKKGFRVWLRAARKLWAKKQELCQVRSAKLLIYVVFLSYFICTETSTVSW